MQFLRTACVTAMALGMSGPGAAAECKWQLKQGRAPTGGGIVCAQGQSEFQAAMFSCEVAPLHLDLEGDCGAGKTACRVRFHLDHAEFQFAGRNHPVREVWDGSVEVPLAGRRDFLDRLSSSARIEVSVEGGRPWAMPTEGLANIVKALARTCRPHTS